MSCESKLFCKHGLSLGMNSGSHDVEQYVLRQEEAEIFIGVISKSKSVESLI